MVRTSAQASAVRVCGAATIIAVVASAIDMARVSLGTSESGGLSMTLGASVFVAAICSCAPLVLIGLAAIVSYKTFARPSTSPSPFMTIISPIDFIATGFLVALLVDLCRKTRPSLNEQAS